MNQIVIPIALQNGQSLEFQIFALSNGSLTKIDQFEATDNGEAVVQITEGCFYEYKLSSPNFYLAGSEIVSPSRINESFGRISPNVWVGTLTLEILDSQSKEVVGELSLEVRSSKTRYRQDYRNMLSTITERCTELLMLHNSPVTNFFAVDFGRNAATIYQRFCFLKSVLETDELKGAIQRIIWAPVTSWKATDVDKDIRSLKRIAGKSLRQIAVRSNRMAIPTDHVLYATLPTVPRRIESSYKKEVLDNAENRFVKHALTTFLSFCAMFVSHKSVDKRLQIEATRLVKRFELYLSHPIFREISIPTSIPMNSPILQRKEGYRELFRTWLMFDLAAKLVWHGGNDVYEGGKKDIAVLYEYWVFFELLEILREVFSIEPKDLKELIKVTEDGLGLQLKQGKHLALSGVYVTKTRRLMLEFSYNRTFSGNRTYPLGGSWTRAMQPDYTLSIWPDGISQEQAETEELIAHVHFDAKYRIDNIADIFAADENPLVEKHEQTRGTYKRADLLKMHAYKDAIRRTAAAFVLYPGDESTIKTGFHELLPGLGAFALSPSAHKTGSKALIHYLEDVVKHFLNRASQRESMSFTTYEIHKTPQGNQVNELLPETYGTNRSLLPHLTFVLIGYYKSQEHYDWIVQSRLYNARAEGKEGPFQIASNVVGARYLLLHTAGDTMTGKLFRIAGSPEIVTSGTLKKLGYPTKPSSASYLVYKLERTIEPEFQSKLWKVSDLERFASSHSSFLPFSVSLADLMQVTVSV